jgi:hypothetical protein
VRDNGAWGRLVGEILDLTSAATLGEVSVDEYTGRVRVRFTPAAGCRSFLVIEERDDAMFAPMYRVEASTLVGARPDGDLREDIIDFLDDANSGAFGGTWVLYSDGDLGVSGAVMFTDPAQPGLAALVAQLLVLQAENAVLMGRPPLTKPFEDLRPPNFPERFPARTPAIGLEDVASRLWFRSGANHHTRFLHGNAGEGWVSFAAPMMVGEPVLDVEMEPLALPHLVTIAQTEHPRLGPGFMFQITLDRADLETWFKYRQWPDPMLIEPWFGTALGALMLWKEQGQPVLVYRGFVPEALCGVLDDDQAVDFVVDSVLGAVNRCGVFEALVSAHESGDHPDDITESLDRSSGYLQSRYRIAALRSATHPSELGDGLVDMDGPLVDPGTALLDRLALNQLQIGTAPFEVMERGFAWLPGPYAQQVIATAPVPSRDHELVDIVITTHLGSVPASDIDAGRRACVELMATLPLSSLLLHDDGNVVMSSRIAVHEGTWWHRAALAAMTAPVQLVCADWAKAAFELAGVSLDPRTELRERFPPSPEGTSYDSIYDVVPWAREGNPTGCPPVADLIALLTSRLHELPGSRLFGDLDNDPDVVVRFADLSDGGGWDPDIGEAMVMLDEVDHEVAGQSLRVRIHPGFDPGAEDHVAEALRLTALSHAESGIGMAPSWVLVNRSIAPTIVLPRICLDVSTLGPATEIAMQAVQSATRALARAVIADPGTFPDFDRNQVNLTRCEPPRPVPTIWAPHTAVWAPIMQFVVTAFPLDLGPPEHWHEVFLDHLTARHLAEWLSGEDNSLLFESPTKHVTGRRDPAGTVLVVEGLDVPLIDHGATALASQLAHPEGAAAGWMPGRVVTYPIESGVDSDGDPWLAVPPAAVTLRVMGHDDLVCNGISALTEGSAWLQFRSPAGTVEIDLEAGFVEWLLEHCRPERVLVLTIAFPGGIDTRVTDPPPPPSTFELDATEIQDALEQIRRAGESGRSGS